MHENGSTWGHYAKQKRQSRKDKYYMIPFLFKTVKIIQRVELRIRGQWGEENRNCPVGIEFQLWKRKTSGDLLYNILPIINNTVLYT